MKNLYIYLLSFIVITASSCTYDFPPAETPTAGSADFTKIVAVGNSVSAGFMDGALYDAGQAAAFPNLIAQQMRLITVSDFNQPDIASPIGNFGTQQGVPLGHLILQGLASPFPAPIVPGDPFNTSYSGDRTQLNSFSVPGVRIVDLGFAGYGQLNPYFGRFASSPTASVLGDALAANGSFFTFFVGNNDVLGYAIAGATGELNGDGTNPNDMTGLPLFEAAYNGSITAMLAGGAKGVVGNIPYVQNLPFFTVVPWNSIPMDQATADFVNGQYTTFNGGIKFYNAGLLPGQDPANPPAVKRDTIGFVAGANGIVMYDSSMVDLNVYGIPTIRQSNSSDLITLAAGLVLGTELVPGNPATVIGVGVPLAEEYSLIPADQEAIQTRIDAYNEVIANAVNANAGNLALVDINNIYNNLQTTGASINGSGLDATIFPPFGAFSLDGLHPNQRGSAYLASLFIDQINMVFGSNIPNLNPNDYAGNPLPVP